MKTTPLGWSDLQTTRLIYGCMRLPATWNPADIDAQRRAEAFAALEAAIDAGYRHFDHADIYCRGACESLFGEFLREHAGLREQIIITTKCGIRGGGDPTPDAPHRYDFSANWIRNSCERSLQRLGIEQIDVYLLHRPDVLMDPDEVAEVFAELRQEGKARYFGVSNFTTSQVALLSSRLDEPLVCNQIEIHPLRLSPIEDGTLDRLSADGITPTAWSPIAGGRVGDEATSDDEQRAKLLATLDQEAEAYGVTRSAIVLAWLMRHPSGILPIVGSRNPQRIADAAKADSLEMSRESWYRIYLAARGTKLP